MKPLMTESRDNSSLQALGRASVQIVHDLKNQINGLKLYATFLRKRSERTERPADEIETINKLITGLDRTAADLSMIVEFGQPVELNKQRGTDLQKLMEAVTASLNQSPRMTGALTGPIVVQAQGEALLGDFDTAKLSEALKSISMSAMKMLGTKSPDQSLSIVLKRAATAMRPEGVIEWEGFESFEHDPFHSFIGSDGIRMSLAARVVEAHGGSADRHNGTLRVRLPLAS
jgi:light-regulated signal transduction histidine kinase (bacteriophytochrome)